MIHPFKMSLAAGLALGLLALFATPAPAVAQSYAITDLGNVTAFDVNDGAQVVGAVPYMATRKSPAYSRAFVWAGGVRTELGTLGGPTSVARSVNNRGQVVGYSDTAAGSGTQRAFLWDRTGGMRDLNHVAGANGVTAAQLGWTLAYAYAINDAGMVVGRGDNGDGLGSNGFLWRLDADGNVSVERVTLGITHDGMSDGGSETGGLNEVGHAAGSVGYTSPNCVSPLPCRQASVWLGSTGNVSFGAQDGRHSHAHVINDAGQSVGYTTQADGSTRAFIWDIANGLSGLGTLGGSSSHARDINNSGTAVGSSKNTAGAERAFVWDAANGMRDLNGLSAVGSSWLLQSARSVSDAGHVVGAGALKSKNSSQPRAFLLTPSAF